MLDSLEAVQQMLYLTSRLPNTPSSFSKSYSWRWDSSLKVLSLLEIVGETMPDKLETLAEDATVGGVAMLKPPPVGFPDDETLCELKRKGSRNFTLYLFVEPYA